MSAHATGQPVGAWLGRAVVLTRLLAVAEFKLRYLDTALSYLWGVLRPLGLFGVIYFVFTHVGKLDHGVPHYSLYILTAIILWQFFADSTSTAVACLVTSAELLRKVPFPRSAIPLSVVLRAFFDLCLNLVALLVFLLASGVEPRLSWIEFPFLLLALALFAAGLSLLLSALFVRYRDIDQIWLLVRQALFYASPIIYAITSLPQSAQRPLSANPLAAILTQARHALVDPTAPTAASALGGSIRLLVPAAIVLIVCAAGVVVFARASERLAESV